MKFAFVVLFFAACVKPLPTQPRAPVCSFEPELHLYPLEMGPICWTCDGGPTVFEVDNTKNDCRAELTYACEGEDGELEQVVVVDGRDTWRGFGTLMDKARVGDPCWRKSWRPVP